VKIKPGETRFAFAACNPGEVAVGGGGLNEDKAGVHLLQSYPETGPGGTPTEWEVSYENTTALEHTIFAIVVCASP
jgi:hypothetical protein